MLLPALNKARAAGQAAVCRSNLKQQGLAFAGYEADFDSYIPPSKGAVDVGGGNYEFLDWQWALTAYIGLNPDLCRDKYSQGKAWRESTVFWCKAPIATIPSGTTLNPKNTGNDTYRYAINSNFISKKTQNGKIDLANLSRYGVLLQQPEHAELDVPRRLQSGKYPARKRNQSAVSRLPRRLCEIHSDSAFFRKYFLDK